MVVGISYSQDAPNRASVIACMHGKDNRNRLLTAYSKFVALD